MSQPRAGGQLAERGLEKNVAGCAVGTEDRAGRRRRPAGLVCLPGGMGCPTGSGACVRERVTGPDLVLTARPSYGAGDTHRTRRGRKRREAATRLWRSHGRAAAGWGRGRRDVDGLEVPGGRGGRERDTQAWRLEAPWRPRGDGAGAAAERGPRPAWAIGLEPAPGAGRDGPKPSCPRRPRPAGGRAAGVWKKGVKTGVCGERRVHKWPLEERRRGPGHRGSHRRGSERLVYANS